VLRSGRTVIAGTLSEFGKTVSSIRATAVKEETLSVSTSSR
jgi:hypothetical protein